MIIERVEAIPFRIPLKRPSRWGAAGHRTASEHVLVRVYSSSGAWGVAEATPRETIYGETQESVLAVIERHLGPRLVGVNPLHREAYWRRLDKIPWNPTAKGALDIAVHDLLARELGVPLVELLGGHRRDIPVSYMVGLGTTAELMEDVQRVKEAYGIRAFKIKVGRDPAEDVERVRLVREAAGPDAFIFVDANQLYEPPVAVATIRAMARYGLAMVEEPVPIGLGPARRKVADSVDVPILGDDSLVTLDAARRELADGAVGVVGIKPPRTGIWNSVKIAHLAQAFHRPVWIGSQGVSGIGTLASAHFAAAYGSPHIPADLGNFIKQEDDLLAKPAVLAGGRLHLPGTSGTGAVIDEDKLAAYRTGPGVQCRRE